MPVLLFDGKWEEIEARYNYVSIEKWIEFWDTIYDKYGNVHIEIAGGEAFIYPTFIEIILELSKKHTLEILSF